jgi:hydroxymethylpyrimidine/phosphomethylpyrimidine kinase
MDIHPAPTPRFDHRNNALGMLGIGQVLELTLTDVFQTDAAAGQRRLERVSPGGTFQRRRNRRTPNRNAAGERLLDETNSFGQGQPAPFPAAAAVQVSNQRLEGAAHAGARPMKIALTIAGSDSGGGAGIQADLKTFQQFGVFGTTVIVALTAQNTRQVRAVESVPENMVTEQLTALAEDLPPAALKTGMLAEAALVRLVARAIRENGWGPLVVDPVMVATSGARLLSTEAEEVVREDLLPLAALVTPNLDEAAILTGRVVHDAPTMERAGATLLRFGAGAALIKGGHLSGPVLTDILVTPSGIRRFSRPRIDTASVHGTGCTLSAAITAGLALGRPLERAVEDALDFVHRAIAAAPGLGSGHGPLNHTVPAPKASQ